MHLVTPISINKSSAADRPGSRSTMRLEPKAVRRVTEARMRFRANRPDDRGLFAARIPLAWRSQHAAGILRGDDRHQLSFISDIERVQAQQFARSPDFLAHRGILRSSILILTPGFAPRFRLRVLERPPRVGSRRQRTFDDTASISATSAVQRRGVAHESWISNSRLSRLAMMAVP